MNPDLARLAEEYWEFVLEANPTQALMLGDHRYDDRFEDLSRRAEDAHIARRREFTAAAEAIDPQTLTPDERITRETLIFEAASQADVMETRWAEFYVSHTVGMHTLVPVEIPQYPLTAPEHAQAMPSRFRGIAQAFDDAADRLREGVANGRTPMRSTAEKTVAQVDRYLASDLADDPHLRLRAPEDWEGEPAWRQEMEEIVAQVLRPAYRRWRDVIADEVVPASRPDDRAGLCWLEGGEAAYATALYRFTTTDLKPDRIHEIGLRQVEALAEEYRALGAEVLGTTDLAQIFDRLREDPDLHFDSGPPIVAASEEAMARAKEAMGKWFGRLPQVDCRVEEVSSGPAAYYFRPAADGSRPGIFFVNTEDPTRWATFEIEALAFHEGIPGHHLQLAIAMELEDVPEFRKNALISAYAEGWGLYAERLADEMGLYSGPLQRIGMLSNDSLRAGRLVVDTGIHDQGWSRQRVMDFLAEHTALSLHEVRTETDRYISWPGQALAYKMGELKIKELRRQAEKELGTKFEVRAFHDVVLGSGAVPLTVLEENVKRWIGALTP